MSPLACLLPQSKPPLCPSLPLFSFLSPFLMDHSLPAGSALSEMDSRLASISALPLTLQVSGPQHGPSHLSLPSPALSLLRYKVCCCSVSLTECPQLLSICSTGTLVCWPSATPCPQQLLLTAQLEHWLVALQHPGLFDLKILTPACVTVVSLHALCSVPSSLSL